MLEFQEQFKISLFMRFFKNNRTYSQPTLNILTICIIKLSFPIIKNSDQTNPSSFFTLFYGNPCFGTLLYQEGLASYRENYVVCQFVTRNPKLVKNHLVSRLLLSTIFFLFQLLLLRLPF